MKIAVVGSRDIKPSIEELEKELYDADEIVSGGAAGVDTCAMEYAESKGIRLTVFLPQYELYGRAAPIVRNKQIVDHADRVVIFWNGISKGTYSVIKYSNKINKECKLIIIKD